MTAINEGSGQYLVTGMNGNITINGTTETVSGLTQFVGTWTPGAYNTITTAGGWSDSYDDVVDLATSPEVDQYGLEFSLNGYSNPLNLCSGTAPNCAASGLNTYLDDAPVDIGAQISFSAVSTSEPSAMGMLTLGLLGLLVYGRRRYLRSC